MFFTFIMIIHLFHTEGALFVCLFVYVLSANDFEKGLFTSESQDIIKQYLCFTLNENHDDDDDDESDCINADDINDDD